MSVARPKYRWLAALLLSQLFLSPASSVAETGSQPVTTQGVNLSQSERYFDGTRWRELWISEQEVAEVVRDDIDASILRSLAPGAKPVRQSPGLRIWRLDQLTAGLTRSLSGAGITNFTPVFHLSDAGGPRLVLTGRLTVAFKQNMAVADVTAWADQQGLTFLHALSMPGVYVFDAGEGLSALEQANRIQESGMAKYALPEWWREAYKR